MALRMVGFNLATPGQTAQAQELLHLERIDFDSRLLQTRYNLKKSIETANALTVRLHAVSGFSSGNPAMQTLPLFTMAQVVAATREYERLGAGLSWDEKQGEAIIGPRFVMRDLYRGLMGGS